MMEGMRRVSGRVAMSAPLNADICDPSSTVVVSAMDDRPPTFPSSTGGPQAEKGGGVPTATTVLPLVGCRDSRQVARSHSLPIDHLPKSSPAAVTPVVDDRSSNKGSRRRR
nr:hypothetical protein Itr_chr14CG05570 [Ipomoea trifida]